ncbi:hypothetical protein GQ472_03390 [archaeon]|nr:hypothetical protein [archaeon]
MQAEDILKEIEREAEDKKYHINQRCTEDLNRIKLELEIKKTEEKNRITEEAEEDIRHTGTQMMGRARLSQKLKLMEKRKELIDSLIDNGVKKFLTSKDYEKFLESAFKNTYKKDMSISIRKDDKKAEAFLKKKKIKPSHAKITGGFIFTDKKIHINKSFDLHLEERRDEIEREIAEMIEM